MIKFKKYILVKYSKFKGCIQIDLDLNFKLNIENNVFYWKYLIKKNNFGNSLISYDRLHNAILLF